MNLENRIKSIEEKVMRRADPVDPQDKLVVVAAPQSELEKEIERREQELAQRYGKEALGQITIVGVITRFGAG